MRYDTKVTVYKHSDWAGCDCGEDEWFVQLPDGWMWVDHAGPGPFHELEPATAYAHTLYPGHPDITRTLQPDQWDFPGVYLTEAREVRS